MANAPFPILARQTGVPISGTRPSGRTAKNRHHPTCRNRRKDQLLQEAGYFVLRFLAEDIGKHLDAALDTIQRTLFSRQTRPS